MINHISGSGAVKTCDFCHKTESADAKISKCGRCRIAQYCGVECQKKAWPTHKSVCVQSQQPTPPSQPKKQVVDPLIQLEEACKLPSPDYSSPNETIKQMKILEAALECLKQGHVEIAHRSFLDNTFISPIRAQYAKAYARYMLKQDKNCYSAVIAEGPRIIAGGVKEMRRFVIDELCMIKKYGTAYRCAHEVDEINERAHLLEVVASALMLAGKQEHAKWVVEKNPDAGRRRDLEESLNHFFQ